jgi:two-component system OmpR family sensor kinase
MSIRARVARSVVVLVALAVVVFGGFTYLVVDRTLRTSFHAQLDTLVRAVASTVDVHGGSVSIDRGDLLQIAFLHPGLPYALFDEHHHRVVGDLLPPPARRRGIDVVTVPVVRGGHVYGWVAGWEADGWISAFERALVLGIVTIGGVLVGIGIIVSQRTAAAALAPLDAIAALTERIEAYDLSSRLHSGDDGELGRICASFDRMLDRLEAGFARERRFVADVSHELRTPLAVIAAESELALRRDRSPQEYREAIASIARETERLGELTAQLLDAARAELDTRELRAVDVNRIVSGVASRVRPAAEVRDVRVDVEAGDRAMARANEGALERALLAVVHNAIDHASGSGAVRLGVRARNGVVRVTVSDDGPGFTPAALAHATERFWRGDGSQGRSGTGLGLSIAKAMLEAAGGSIVLANGAAGGALVTIVLPSAA